MSNNTISPKPYDELMARYKDYITAFDSIYKLNSNEKNEISKVYKLIKTNLIETKIIMPDQMINIISEASNNNLRYLNGYLAICKLIYDEYHPQNIVRISKFFDYFAHKEYGIFFDEKNKYKVKKFEIDRLTKAILNDDQKALMHITQSKNFNVKQKIKNVFEHSSYIEYSLLELCCFHGSVNCFNYLTSTYNSKITSHCLAYSFLHDNNEIREECMKAKKPNWGCMMNALVSHHNDYVLLLLKDKEFKINLETCVNHNNLQAFLIYLDQTNEMGECFQYSGGFNLPGLCEYFLSHGVSVNNQDENVKMSIYHAAYHGCYDSLKYLISRGINVRDVKPKYGPNPLNVAVRSGSIETAELLIKNGVEVNSIDSYNVGPLCYAIENGRVDMVRMLIAHGAEPFNRKIYFEACLTQAVRESSLEVVEFLLSLGASILEGDDNEFTPFITSFAYNRKDMAYSMLFYKSNVLTYCYGLIVMLILFILLKFMKR
ncbi:hypothetical protein TVAG_141550 [Trichomonas vaginalis G3]|uniref:DUF3447 domain-containing protein n=1 Tax=Trichomonas vaginalis (strain ATCC PRA-98 / G3) TaxID=412133 RepID=A2FSU9_TRIV3|nr:spectrin binding [Trichomonas vaginalis G3]EAX92038.1 hypothetical protein TVAG_141550 [Trichomonas vaginalis G3]KAI5548117.1 spectrin binding [Trichomonas vaginalis G3]|eukprot:XP_001304968.1 hypothetical protein [Trichomonas vaginalis G3]